MNKNLLSIGLVAILVGALLFSVNKNDTTEVNRADIKQLVHDYSVGNIQAASASITSEQLIVTNNKSNEVTYDLPEDEFFVSIAPFVNQTHPCAIHSLTGCQGELVKEEFDVLIKDTDGNIVVDDTMTSLENGFIDLWLPRDRVYSVTLKHDGKTANSILSTYVNDNTCITTIQLEASNQV